MQVENTYIVAEPIYTWGESSIRGEGIKQIVDHYELRKVYANYDNDYFIIEREGKLSKITVEKFGEYRDNFYKHF